MIAYSGCPDGGCGGGVSLLLALGVALLLLLAYIGAIALVRARLTDRDAARRRQTHNPT